jgi:hypothetical protein
MQLIQKVCNFLGACVMTVAFGRPGSDLLSRVLRRSTIGAGAFHGRVRNGIGCSHPAVTTRSAKRNVHACGFSGACDTNEKLVLFV